ncbi:hypothetical protein DL546_006821 [Coniochaeta pulveracea]|uniref:Glycosyltransferase family 28 N-terminal domain-containing protein n=1 Tax=Coniochaeta pulveracea TaxID=177199 RepID=A0A420YLT9_9PEZI|nr:hypothetical protein DL546_006821 [Coniochaeta pulveracea]
MPVPCWYMVKIPGLIPSMESLRGGDVGRKRRMMKEVLQGCWASCIQPDPLSEQPFVADAIIANPPSFAHAHCAQALGVPVHIMFTLPYVWIYPAVVVTITFVVLATWWCCTRKGVTGEAGDPTAVRGIATSWHARFGHAAQRGVRSRTNAQVISNQNDD